MKTNRNGWKQIKINENRSKWIRAVQTLSTLIQSAKFLSLWSVKLHEIQMVANDYIIEENQMKIEKLSWGEKHKSFCSMNLEEPKKNHL